MTARPGRRRRTTLVAAGGATAALLLTGGLTYAGAMTLWNSTEGDDAASSVPELAFPDTPSALLAGVDADGALASLAAVVVQPDGAGGSIVSLPVSADATAGEGDERLPIAETFEVEGPESLEREAEITLGVSFDVVEVAAADRLAELLAPLGNVAVELPEDVTDAGGDLVAEAGSTTLDADGLAEVLTTRDPSIPAAEQFAAAAAVWDGVGAAVGDGIAPSPDASMPAAAPPSFEAVLTPAMAGPLGAWDVRSQPIEDSRNPRGVDVALLDRAELALIFGQIAPGKVSAPNPSLSFRVVVAFSDEQLAGRPWKNVDIAYRAISQILFLRSNVISVDTTPGEAPETNVAEVSDQNVNTDGADDVFGSIEVVEAEERIVGIDAVLHLGEAYLDFLDAVEADRPGTVASVPSEDAGEDDVEPTSAPATTTND